MVNKNYKLGSAIREGTFIVVMVFAFSMAINTMIPIDNPQLSLAISFIISWLVTIGMVFIYHKMFRKPLGSRRG